MRKMHTVIAIMFCILTLHAVSSTAENFSEIIGEERELTPTEIHTILGKIRAERLARQWEIDKSLGELPAAGQTDFDVKFYDVNIRVDFDNRLIYGDVKMAAGALFDGIDSIPVDFYANMNIDSVYNNGGQLGYRRNANIVIVALDRIYNAGETFAFNIAYNGLPIQGGLQAFSMEYRHVSHDSFPVISSLSEPYMARTWWPCKDRPDDKADSMDISITCDTSIFCASNGKLIDTTRNGDGTWSFNYKVRYPITTYLFSVSISNFIVWKNYYHYGPTDSMEIIHHVYAEKYDYSLTKYNITPDAVAVLAGYYGEYPFIEEKYGHANFEWGGGMEHQTCTSMSGTWFGFYEPIVVHELSHQWWGDMITCESWHDIWLNEGFASYSEALYYEAIEGTSSYHDYMAGMDYAYGKTIYVYDTTDVDEIFDIVVYDKGAWLLHMLRHVVGDVVFFNILDSYANSSARFSHANSAFFQDICETVSGQDLDYFFDQWLYGTYRPSYVYEKYSEIDPVDSRWRTYIRLRQTQATNPKVFKMPIDLVFNYSTADPDTIVLFNDVRDTIYSFKTDNEPISINFDPQKWILRYAGSSYWVYHLIPTILSNGTQYAEYIDSVFAKGGSGQHRYSIADGELPFGLELDSLSGVISGMPHDFGDFPITIKAVDFLNPAANEETDQTISITEAPIQAGDVDEDGNVNLEDILAMINFVYVDRIPPNNVNLADVNRSCNVNLSDILYLIQFVYLDGPLPLMGCVEP